MAGGGFSGLTSQTFAVHFPAGLTRFLFEIPPDHIQVTVGIHCKNQPTHIWHFYKLYPTC